MSPLRAALAAALVLGLVGCGAGNPGPAVDTSQWEPPTSASGWTAKTWNGFTFVAVPIGSLAGGVFALALPAYPADVDYITTPAPAPLRGASITLTIEVSGTGQAVPSPDDGAACMGTPRARVFIQRAGDDLSGTNGKERFRWWSATNLTVPLSPGVHSIRVPLDASAAWIDVTNERSTDQPQGFADALANVAFVGFTLGRCSAGHGASASGGSVQLALRGFAINR